MVNVKTDNNFAAFVLTLILQIAFKAKCRTGCWCTLKRTNIFPFGKSAACMTFALLLLKLPAAVAATPAPIISVDSGTLVQPNQVAIAGVTGSKVYSTTDGTTPTTASDLYSKPINVTHSLTLKAITVVGGVSSAVSTRTYVLDPLRYPAPNPAVTTQLKINLEQPTTGIPTN